MEIRDILEPNEYNSLNQFSQEDKDWINGRIKIRRNGSAGIECVKRGMNRDGDYFELTPEEIVRQHYAHKLIEEYGYKKEQISFEEPVFLLEDQELVISEWILLFLMNSIKIL